MTIPITYYLVLSAIVFLTGLVGVLIRRNIIAILLVRIPGVYLTSIWFPDTLFPMGITTACGSLTSIIICLLVFRYLKKKPIRTAV